MIKIVLLFALILSLACATNRSTPDHKHIIGTAMRPFQFGTCGGPAPPLGCFDATPYPCLLAEGNLQRCEQDYARVPVQHEKSGTVSVSSNKPAAPDGEDDRTPANSTSHYSAAGDPER